MAPFDFDETSPGDSAIVADFPLNERNHRLAVHDAFEIEHDEADGLHDYITLKEQAADIAAVANQGKFYTKDDGGVTEAFYRDSAGNILQLTSGGVLLDYLKKSVAQAILADLTMTGAQINLDNAEPIAGDIAATGTLLALIQRNASDQCEVGETTQEMLLRADDANGLKLNYGSGDKEVYHAGNTTLFFTLEHISAELAITHSSNVETTHGMTTVKALYTKLVCKVDDTGYVVGDEISLSSLSMNARATNPGIVVYVSGTKIKAVIADNGVRALDLTTHTDFGLTPGSWKLVISAWGV